MLKTNNIHSQQILNNREEKLREGQHTIVDFSFGEWFVEEVLSIYKAVYKPITFSIQQFIVFTNITKSSIRL